MNLQEHLQIGQLISDRYELVRFLGQGGFAVVWQARDMVVERDVALKFLTLGHMALNDDAVSRTILERFEREAKLAASIRHPNVVGIFDIGAVNGDKTKPFIAMELLNGLDLQDYLARRGAIPATKLWPLLLPCLDALAMAHARGIVHKDLKPSNLFLSDPDQRAQLLRLTDFGIAHIHAPNAGEDVKARLTQTGQFMGTPAYLPPEYINQQTISPALDVYQMCLIIAEILSGEQIVNSENSLQCLLIHGDGRLELPDYLLKSPLGPVLLKGLALEPKDRYRDAGALADAIQSIDPATIPSPSGQGTARISLRDLDPKTLTAPPQPPPPPPEPPNATRRLAALLGVALVAMLLFVGAAIGAIWYVKGSDEEASQALIPNSAPSVAELEAAQATPKSPQQAPEPEAPAAPEEDPATPADPAAPDSKAEQEAKLREEIRRQVQAELERAKQAPDAAPEPDPAPEDNTEAIPDDPDDEAPETSGQGAALRAKAEKIMRSKPREAIQLCERAALLGEFNCYNVIMRSAWRPGKKPGVLEDYACGVLKGLRSRKPQHTMSINIQRSFLKCEERGL